MLQNVAVPYVSAPRYWEIEWRSISLAEFHTNNCYLSRMSINDISKGLILQWGKNCVFFPVSLWIDNSCHLMITHLRRWSSILIMPVIHISFDIKLIGVYFLKIHQMKMKRVSVWSQVNNMKIIDFSSFKNRPLTRSTLV